MSYIKLTNEQVQALKSMDDTDWVDMRTLGKLLDISTTEARNWARWNCSPRKINGDICTPDFRSKCHLWVPIAEVKKVLRDFLGE